MFAFTLQLVLVGYSTLTYVIHMYFTIERKKGERCMIVQIMGSIYEGIVICILKPQHASLKVLLYLSTPNFEIRAFA